MLEADYEKQLPTRLCPYRNRTKKLITLYACDHMLNANKNCMQELWTVGGASQAACRPGLGERSDQSLDPPPIPRTHSSRRSLKQEPR
jgi:hypothetical protein